MIPCPIAALVFDHNYLTRPGVGTFKSKIAYKLLQAPRWPWSKRSPDDDHDFYRLRAEWVASSSLRWRLESRLKTVPKPDLLHLHTQAIALRLPGWRPLKCPYVVSIDNTSALLGKDRPDKIRRSLKGLMCLEQRCFAAAAHIISWTDRARRSVIDDYGITPSRVTRIYPSTSPAFFDYFSKSSVKKTKIGVLPRLLFVGNDFTRKGGHELIDVYAKSLYRNCELDIISNDLLNLPNIPGLRHFRGLGHDSPDWYQIFVDADIFVLPTREDCLGIAFIEGMTAGLPLIGSSVMSVPEVVRNGVNALSVPPNDVNALSQAIEQLVGDPILRAKLAAGSRALAEREFNPRINASRVADIYRLAVSNRQ